ncbi:MAG: hypothetical protein E5V77_22965 [Mesorhizobium sp.]|nr:MAG: hypothetical protein E5V77_22965 [Mesorhizobium sp.]
MKSAPHGLVGETRAELDAIGDTEGRGRRQVQVEAGFHHRRIACDGRAGDREGGAAGKGEAAPMFSAPDPVLSTVTVPFVSGLIPT